MSSSADPTSVIKASTSGAVHSGSGHPIRVPSSVVPSMQPIVTLVNAFDQPYNNAIATARTCYSSRVITSADVDRDDAARQLRDAIAASTYQAGHHTTIQHATFQFILDNVSRQFVWSFLHAHPYYNSEQVSQRYVAVKPDKVLLPTLPTDRCAQLYEATVRAQMACYTDLVALLQPPTRTEYFRIFPARQKHAESHEKGIRKKAQEIARYALPVATTCYLYHTISGVTLHRYHRLCNMLDVPQETRLVVTAMVAEVNRWDPLFFAKIEDPIALEHTHEYQLLTACSTIGVNPSARAFRDQFDAELNGRASRLLDYKINAEHMLARSVRNVIGVTQAELSDDDAIAWVLSPSRNPYLAGALNLNSLGKLTRAMVHPHYTFQKKLSHTADSQDQRHRTTPGTRPILHTHYVGGEPDVIVPELLRQNSQALDRFMGTMRQTWNAIDALLDDGVQPDVAMYLLPNAFPIRFEESGDLMGLHHKWTTRLCYNAQEEIWRASLEEVQQVRDIHPRIGRYLGPPCTVRRDAGVRPICPEGPRFCGVPVWRLNFADYTRLL